MIWLTKFRPNQGDATAFASESSTPPDINSRVSVGANLIASYMLFATIAIAPLPFGSRDATTIALWCILLGIAAVLVSIRHLGNSQQALVLGIGFVAACYCFVLHEQLSDTPWIASMHPLWAEASDLLGVKLIPAVSIAKLEPFYSLGPPLAAVLALTLASSSAPIALGPGNCCWSWDGQG